MKACKPKIIPGKYNETIDLIAAGDLHWWSAESDHALWWKMFDEYPKGYFIFLGDLLHSIGPNDKRSYGSRFVKEAYEPEALGDLIEAEIDDFVRQMKSKLGEQRIQKYILGCISGNHPFAHVRKGFGFNPHKRMCKELGIQNLGYDCFLPIVIQIPVKKRRELMIYAHHGFGGGSRTPGGNVTKFTNHSYGYKADICLYGHTHDKWVRKLSCMRHTRSIIPDYEDEGRVVAQTGTFQGTLSKDEMPSWAETMGFPVRSLGWITIHITPKRKQKYGETEVSSGESKKLRSDRTYLDIRVEE